MLWHIRRSYVRAICSRLRSYSGNVPAAAHRQLFLGDRDMDDAVTFQPSW